ncbi:MAG: hypothetical protein ACRC0X_00585 [Brevinema sp.]
MKTLFLVFLLINSASYSQQLKNNIIIQDVSGEVQTRTVPTPTWTPITAGLSVSSKSFIRLNSPNSIATLRYPDGSLLRLIGVGSFFLEQISEAEQNVYHSKILVLSGRWFYQSNPLYNSRFIANTDITTSVLEQGTGGGFFYQGTNEFVLLKGRGLISYRQKNINAIVLDERQYVQFNILDGFFQPKLATDKVFEYYIVFPDQTTSQNTSSVQLVSYNNMPYRFAHDPKANQQKKPVSRPELQLDQLDPLKYLKFPRRADRSQITMYQLETNKEPEMRFQETVQKPIIPKELLEAIDIKDFKITPPPRPQEITPAPQEETTEKTPPVRQRPTRTQREITKQIIEEETKEVPIVEDTEDIDLNELLEQIQEDFDKEQRQRTRTPRQAQPTIRIQEVPIVEDSEDNNLDELLEQIQEDFDKEQRQRTRTPRQARPTIPIREVPLIEEAIFEPLAELEQEEISAPTRTLKKRPRKTPTESPQRVPSQQRPKRTPQQQTDKQVYEEDSTETTLYVPPDWFFNRDLDSDNYRYRQFKFEEEDDILNSDLSIFF